MNLDLLDITEDDARGLCELAGHDLAMARHYRECAHAAEDGVLKNDYGRSYQRMARSYRQTLAMKLRLKRALTEDDRAQAAELAKAVEAARKDAARERAEARDRHRWAVAGRMERLIWNEYEPDDASEVFREVHDSLEEIADAPDFLDLPVETLVRDLCRTFRLGEFSPETPDAPSARSAAASPMGQAQVVDAAAPPPPAGEVAARRTEAQPPLQTSESLDFDAAPEPDPPPLEEVAQSTPIGGGSRSAGGAGSRSGSAGADGGPPPPLETSSDGCAHGASEGGASAPAPPPKPPDPEPAPYVPPWEHPRAGRRFVSDW